jgi:hypothetical protein
MSRTVFTVNQLKPHEGKKNTLAIDNLNELTRKSHKIIWICLRYQDMCSLGN